MLRTVYIHDILRLGTYENAYKKLDDTPKMLKFPEHMRKEHIWWFTNSKYRILHGVVLKILDFLNIGKHVHYI
jgi:hypothetical protein